METLEEKVLGIVQNYAVTKYEPLKRFGIAPSDLVGEVWLAIGRRNVLEKLTGDPENFIRKMCYRVFVDILRRNWKQKCNISSDSLDELDAQVYHGRDQVDDVLLEVLDEMDLAYGKNDKSRPLIPVRSKKHWEELRANYLKVFG